MRKCKTVSKGLLCRSPKILLRSVLKILFNEAVKMMVCNYFQMAARGGLLNILLHNYFESNDYLRPLFSHFNWKRKIGIRTWKGFRL